MTTSHGFRTQALLIGLLHTPIEAQILLRDINPTGSSEITRAVPHADFLHFAAHDGARNSLWISDGTPNGTLRHPLASDPNQLESFARVGTDLLFLKPKDSSTVELWRTDERLQNSEPIGAFTLPTNPFGAIFQWQALSLGDVAYFVIARPYLPFTESVLVRSDGTSSGSRLLLAEPTLGLRLLGGVGSALFFTKARRSPGGGSFDWELWWSDGSGAGTRRVVSFPSTVYVRGGGITFAGRQLFYASDSPRTDLWTSDGSAAGTFPLTDASFGSVQDRAVAAGKLWFVTSTGPTSSSLWTSDGSRGGAAWVATFEGIAAGSLVECQGRLLFVAKEAATGWELWSSAGTPESTGVLADIVSGPASGLAANTQLFSIASHTRVLFAAYEAATGVEPWVSDGTVTGTKRVGDIAAGPASSQPVFLAQAGTNVFLTADDGQVGRELWRLSLRDIDGTMSEPWGRGCGGSHGVPRLTARGVPQLGNTDFTIAVDSAARSSPIAYVIGAGLTTQPLHGGCQSYVAMPALLVPAASDAVGQHALSLAIPNQPALLGGFLAFQCLVLDPQGAWGRVASLGNAWRVLIGS